MGKNLKSRCSPPRKPGKSKRSADLAQSTVGRQSEIQKLQDFADRGIHTLVLGPPGVGKSHLLKLLQGEKLIRLPGLSPQRETMLTLAEALYERGALKGNSESAPKGHHPPGGALGPRSRCPTPVQSDPGVPSAAYRAVGSLFSRPRPGRHRVLYPGRNRRSSGGGRAALSNPEAELRAASASECRILPILEVACL